MFKISAETRGYLLTGVIVFGLLALGVAALWAKAHPAKDPAFTPEWRCTDPEQGEVCERIRPPNRPKAPRTP